MLKNINVKQINSELLSGFVTFLALLPEALGFTIVAGVDPVYGIIATFFMSLSTSLFKARPAMISGAAGATALVLAHLVETYPEHGVQYLLMATLLAGIIQVLLFKINYDKLLKFVTPAITFGFLNGLGILMFMSQTDNFSSYLLIGLAAITVAIIFLLRKSKIPSPVIALVIMSVATFTLDVPRLGDMGNVALTEFGFQLDLSLLNFDTLLIILPTAISVAFIGLLESLLTAKVISNKIDDGNDQTNNMLISVSQGLGNILNGLFGGMAGCGMIGQSIMNMSFGGRGRLSTFMAGFFFLVSAIFLSSVLNILPLFALAGIMVVISYETFSFESVKLFTSFTLKDKLALILTTVIVVITHNLFYGVAVGIIITLIFNVIKKEKING